MQFFEEDLVRIRAARGAAEGVRRRARCLRCRKRIPDCRRADALYCSEECHDRHRREEVSGLRSEVRAIVRALAPTTCDCGAPLSVAGKSGPIPRRCRRCANREAQRRHMKKLKGVRDEK